MTEDEMDAYLGPWDAITHTQFCWHRARPGLILYARWYLVVCLDWIVRKAHFGPDGWTAPDGTQMVDDSRVLMYACDRAREGR